MNKEKEELLIRALKGRAEVLLLIGEHKNALSDYNKIKLIKKDIKTKIYVLIKMSIIYDKMGDPLNAKELAEKVYEIAKENDLTLEEGEALNQMNLILIGLGKYSEVLKNANKLLNDFENMLQGSHHGKEVKDLILNILSESLNYKGMVYEEQGNYKKALEVYLKSLAFREKIDDLGGIAVTWNNMGVVYGYQADFKNALGAFNKSLNIKQKMGNKDGVANTYANIGNVHFFKGNLKEAVDSFQKTLKIEKELGNKYKIAAILNNIGLISSYKGNYGKAIKAYDQGVKIQKDMGNEQDITMGKYNISLLYYEKGDYEKFLLMINDAEKIAARLKLNELLSSILCLKSNSFADKGRFQYALKIADQAINIAKKVGLETNIAEALCSKARIQLKKYLQGNEIPFERIENDLKNAEILVKKIDDKEELCEVYTVYIRFYLSKSEISTAKKYCNKLKKTVDEIFLERLLPEFYFLFAKISYIQGKNAREYLRKAEHLAKKMGLKPLLKEIGQLRGEIEK
ncbi:tetratricopeptide repeat protein [bacterium]|nr:tetratricopeptide repeat protein [bacterium]